MQNMIFSTVQHSMFWAVPVFMMITGRLMMCKIKIDYVKAFGYFKRIGLLLVLFGSVFAWMELFFTTRQLNMNILIDGINNMLTGNTWKHLWYLYVLLGIYLILPALNELRDKHTIIKALTLLIILFTSLFPSLHINIGIRFPIDSIYVGYFLLGYLLYQTKNISTYKWVCAVMLFITFVILIIGKHNELILHKELNWNYSSYTSIITVIQSSALFYLIISNPGKFDKFCSSTIVKRLNRCSLGIYITHMVWINLIIKITHINIMPYNFYAILPMCLIVLTLSWLTTEILIRLPILKHYL